MTIDKVAVEHDIPKVRVSMQFKITLPFVLLAVIFAIAFTLLVSRFIMESVQDRFTNQLIDAGMLAADWMVQKEQHMLETLRLLANIEGIQAALAQNDAEQLQQLSLPVVINDQQEAVDFINLQRVSVLSLRHYPGRAIEDYDAFSNDTSFEEVELVQRVLTGESDRYGDKFAGVTQIPTGNYFYVIGPVFDRDRNVVGGVMVGISLSSLTAEMHESIMAHISLYGLDGNMLSSTLFPTESDIPYSIGNLAQTVLNKQDTSSEIRSLSVLSSNYSEILGSWEVRNGEDIGVIGTALLQNFIFRPSSLSRFRAFLLIVLAFFSIFLVGLVLARRITVRLSHVVRATTEVAGGNLDVHVRPQGDDEVAVVAHAFNYMVSGLKEGSIYRDILGRTVSPEVRDTLRQSFAKGDLRLDGQSTVASVMMSDIRGFTQLSEQQEPTTILTWLNEYFGALVPLITAENGVVDKFEGDAILAFFGILPQPLSPMESAYNACKAAIKLLTEINRINHCREERGEPALVTGIAINTGLVTAGGLGTTDRLNYTIIGDPVNTVQRMQDVTRGFGESGIVISQPTLDYLKDHWNEFRFENLGQHSFKGKSETVSIYRVMPVLENEGSEISL